MALSSAASSGFAAARRRSALAIRACGRLDRLPESAGRLVPEVVGASPASSAPEGPGLGGPSAVPKIASRRSTASVRWLRAEPFHGVVDRHVPGQAGGALGGGHLEDAVEVEVEPDDDLVAGVDVGQALDRELADQGVVPGVLVLALEDADLGLLLAVDDGEKISVRVAGRGVLRSMIGAKAWTDGKPVQRRRGPRCPGCAG